MKISGDLQLIETADYAPSNAPTLTIRYSRSKKPTGIITVNKSLRGDLGISENRSAHPVYMQVYISDVSIQLRKCEPESDGARRLGRDGYVRVPELIDLIGLRDGDIWSFPAEAIGDAGALNAVATLPPKLRQRIIAVNSGGRA